MPSKGSPNRNKALLFVLFVPLLLGFSLMLGPSGFGVPDSSVSGRAILSLRFGRFFMGLMVGAALSASGTVFQAILRNPLAEPYVLGVSGGAGLGAALSILVGGGLLGAAGLPLTAFLFAVITLMAVYGIASRGGASPSVYSLILSGVIVSSICSSFIMFLVSTADIEGMHTVVWWMLGNLQPGSPSGQVVSLIIIVTAIGLLWFLAPALNVLTLGREMAHYQGLNAGAVTMSALFLATLLAATAVSMGGMIGFVGLIVPHVMRALFGPDHRWLVPVSAVGGGTFLVLCDAIARSLMPPIEIPVGVVTALCGGPFFLIILRRKMSQAWIA
jgi:iron complex transport system permease protein